MAIDFQALAQSQEAYTQGLKDYEAPSAKTLSYTDKTALAQEINVTPMITIGELEIIVNEFIARRDNPNEVTKRQVGLGDVSNYPVATEANMLDGDHHSYVTPALVKSAFTRWLSDFASGEGTPGEGIDLSGILQAIDDLQAALGGMPTDFSEIISALGNKLDKTGTAVNSDKFAGYTIEQFLNEQIPDVIENLSINAYKLNGRSFDEMVANWADWIAEVDDKFITPQLLKQIYNDQVDPLLDHLTYLFGQGTEFLAGRIESINPLP
jgi:hypothetical protein